MSIRSLRVDGRTCTFEVHGDHNVANAIRRALLSDVRTLAPSALVIRTNTTCLTDEYIANRVGLVPFRRADKKGSPPPADSAQETPVVASIHVSGRDAWCADIVSTQVAPCRDAMLVRMLDGQTLDADIQFAEGTASTHARYSPIGPVSYRSTETPGVTAMGFESMTSESPLAYLRQALVSMQKNLNATKCYIQQDAVCRNKADVATPVRTNSS